MKKTILIAIMLTMGSNANNTLCDLGLKELSLSEKLSALFVHRGELERGLKSIYEAQEHMVKVGEYCNMPSEDLILELIKKGEEIKKMIEKRDSNTSKVVK